MDAISKFISTLLMLALMAGVGYGFYRYQQYEAELARLRAEIATRDLTIVTKDGAYTKLAKEVEGLKATNAALQATIDARSEEVIHAQEVAIFWKKKFEDAVKPVPVPDPDPSTWDPVAKSQCTEKPQEFVVKKNYGLVTAGCKVFTYDPNFQAHTILEPGDRTLKLSIALTRDPSRQWHSYVKVEPPDDGNVSVEITSTSVNVTPLAEKWYEKLSLRFQTGVGSGGALVGLGAGYRFGQFDIGPNFWGVTNGGGATYYGLGAAWMPFKRPQ